MPIKTLVTVAIVLMYVVTSLATILAIIEFGGGCLAHIGGNYRRAWTKFDECLWWGVLIFFAAVDIGVLFRNASAWFFGAFGILLFIASRYLLSVLSRFIPRPPPQ